MIKRRLIFVPMVLAVLVLLASCSKKAAFVIDFEDDTVFSYQTVNFDEAFTEECFDIGEQNGFKGNAFKAQVKAQAEGNTWWVAGMGFNPEYTQNAVFQNLEKITFKYNSGVDYSKEVPFIVQMVWKDVKNREEVASLQVEFPIGKTKGVETFEIMVPSECTANLNEASAYYFDWFMIGLEGNADDLFNPGSFQVDDISFYAN